MTDIVTTPAAEAAPVTTVRASRPVALWRGFARFRRTRPFWGAVILALGAYFIARPLLGGTFEFYTTVGVRSITPLLIAGGMAAAAGIAVVVPAQRHFPAIVALMLAVASLPLANLGGWLIGMVLGILGAGLVFSWTPYSEKQLERFAAKDAARAERRAQKRTRR
ncbi:DUF6114 domain-containing protein [Nocardioides sp. WV_118_6]|uniref:DUF6114 domain-containing protein n=1 Tax=Pimelobacter TaxID=2044 RepID=UPI001C05BEF3|nr:MULTISPECIES: DUF6114 domain-containing protein [Pimelobacter]MBU2694240.1 hypothetical protein [Pimelobacter sp. 30-1]UUW90235.1 DUF6114 domain-containing protein [Pimelobacter simplex]UUW94064.1 DUF6114 domain-containing protein [Pimelobacter simplex]